MNSIKQRVIKQGIHIFVIIVSLQFQMRAEDGYRLWLRYDPVSNEQLVAQYKSVFTHIVVDGNSAISNSIRSELALALKGLIGASPKFQSAVGTNTGLIVGVVGKSQSLSEWMSNDMYPSLSHEGYVIRVVEQNNSRKLVVGGYDEAGALYGVFHVLRWMQTGKSIDLQHVLIENPQIQHRLLNHWDNLDRTVERGYAGFSIWNWHELPQFIDPRYADYARANASLGINGAVVTNVNANALIFRPDYLEKVAALAEVFRAYGIKIYLTARFSAPMELGQLATADPLDPQVIDWWSRKVNELYRVIPDFGGFLVKANSEGQPGPQDYNRNHAEGANMLAKALQPHGGIVMWRAFVYSEKEPDDRAKQAFNEFVPLDGSFNSNVLVQVKNGPIDFQPREPIHPLFGAMPKTPLMMEFQITKEYLGQGTHLVGLGSQFEEVLNTRIYPNGRASNVVEVIDGTLHNHQLTGMAGVSNIGTARNWTGHHFAQADWYVFGRLAWNPKASVDELTREWVQMTFTQNTFAVEEISRMLTSSHETCVRYMTPLGLHHIMAAGHHYGPGPWVANMSRADWTSVYYHRADSIGLGFDRTAAGSDALAQYDAGFRSQLENPETCPLEYLLWFHHVPWSQTLSTGNSLWNELCLQYDQGVKEVDELIKSWMHVKDYVDEDRYRQVYMHLTIQQAEARWWRDACLLYFQQFSKMEFPQGSETPKHSLEYYTSLTYPFAPGIRPRW